MWKRRPRGVLEIGWAALEAEWSGRREHLPHWAEYPDALVERMTFRAGGGHDWRLSALRTPRARPADWKIVVITGAPSWAEYWTGVLAKLGAEREMVVVDRPGFGSSQPIGAVTDIVVQAEALAPLMDGPASQKILLVGQSYGAAIAALIAEAHPDKVTALVLLSGLYGDLGPTAARLVDVGFRMHGVIPRDLRNAVTEVRAQRPQLERMRAALARVAAPIHIIHGERDDFAPMAAAAALAKTLGVDRARYLTIPEANHFINESPPEIVLALLETVIAAASPPAKVRPDLWGRLRALWPVRMRPGSAAPMIARVSAPLSGGRTLG